MLQRIRDMQVCTEEESLFPMPKHGPNYIGVLWHATKDENVKIFVVTAGRAKRQK